MNYMSIEKKNVLEILFTIVDTKSVQWKLLFFPISSDETMDTASHIFYE